MRSSIPLQVCLYCCLGICLFVEGRTRADDLRSRVSDIRLLKGAFLGKVEYVQEALAHPEAANVNAILTPEIGEQFLKIGKAGIDFPVAPALHVAISQGTWSHLRVAHLLLLRGANPNLSNSYSPFQYFPAVYYAMGAFKTPKNSQAALLQKILSTFPQKFSHSAIQDFVSRTGIPPPLHTAVLQNFFDGVYLLSTSGVVHLDDVDTEGLTALHVAAWLGNTNIMLFLLHKGASPGIYDPQGRSFIHVLASRGMFKVLDLLLNNITSPLSIEDKKTLICAEDNEGHSVLDIAMLPPMQKHVVAAIKTFLSSVKITTCDSQFQRSSFSRDSVVENDCEDLSSNDGLDSFLEAEDQCLNVLNKLEPKPPITVSRRDWTKFSRKEFRLQYFSTQRPLKVVGNYTGTMKVWKYLHRDSFLKRYGAHNIIASDIHGSCVDPINCSLSIESFMSKSAFKRDEAIIGRLPIDTTGIDDFAFSDALFSICGFEGNAFMQLISGPHYATPLRSESAMWNVLLSGAERHWLLLSPGAYLNVSTSRSMRSNEDIYDWMESVLPELIANEVVAKVVQRPGDVIFVPYTWGYVTFGVGEAIDVTYYFCVDPNHSSENHSSVFNQVATGIRMYGKPD